MKHITAIIGAVMLTFGLAACGVSGDGTTLPAVNDSPGGQVCGPLDSGKIDTDNEPGTVTVTAPDDYLIDGYCVKAGSSRQADGPVYVTVDPPQKSVTFSYPGGKAISHYSYSYVRIPETTTTVKQTTTTTTEPDETTTTTTTEPDETTTTTTEPDETTTTTVPDDTTTTTVPDETTTTVPDETTTTTEPDEETTTTTIGPDDETTTTTLPPPPPPPPADDTLPITGLGDSGTNAAIAFLLLAAGGAMVLVARRRTV